MSAFIYLHRPACADGSRPQKPEKEGAPPQCEDGNTPVSQSWNCGHGDDIGGGDDDDIDPGVF